MYGILRVEKIKMTNGGLDGRAKHSLREFQGREESDGKIYRNEFDQELSRLNTYIGCKSSSELKDLLQAKWKTCTSKPRKDAVGCLEVVVTTSAGALTKSQEEDFFAMARKEIATWYGDDNILAECIHRDETTPHAHFFVVPLETKNVRKNRLSKREKEAGVPVYVQKTALNAKKMLNGRESMRDLQDDFHAHVFAHFGLDRGQVGSKAKNQRPSLQKKEKELSQKKKDFEEKKEKWEKKDMPAQQKEIADARESLRIEWQKALDDVSRQRQELKDREQKVSKEEKEIETRKENLTRKTKELDEREKNLAEREKIVNEKISWINKKYGEIVRIANLVKDWIKSGWETVTTNRLKEIFKHTDEILNEIKPKKKINQQKTNDYDMEM